ncbi:MAG TPA: hypothetical protein VD963_08890 [Phycisphaerales bacterium]|nr:hypothetical protein [Phycisphaerales bacterium]
MAETPRQAGAGEPRARPPGPPSPKPARALCPYCGSESLNLTRCESCKGYFDPLSRAASQEAMGPWALRDEISPFRPGCAYPTLLALIRRGRLTAESVIRGPTTGQFWVRAGAAPGVANHLGRCHACGKPATGSDRQCAACGADFSVPEDRQYLGAAGGPPDVLPRALAPREAGAAPAEAVGGAARVAARGGFDSQDQSTGGGAQPTAPEAAAAVAEAIALRRRRLAARTRTMTALLGVLLALLLAAVVIVLARAGEGPVLLEPASGPTRAATEATPRDLGPTPQSAAADPGPEDVAPPISAPERGQAAPRRVGDLSPAELEAVAGDDREVLVRLAQGTNHPVRVYARLRLMVLGWETGEGPVPVGR